MPERVSFAAADGVTLVGDYYQTPKQGPAVLLLHMMPATRESWREFAPKLVARGFSVLAIDLRGHGESVSGPTGAIDYRKFSDSEHKASLLDVDAAVRWLEEQGGSPVALVGASIGANLAITYAADHHDIPAVAALSPGWDYRGVTTPENAAKFGASQSLWLAASDDDDFSFQTDKRLSSIVPTATVKELSAAGHGTMMFDRDPVLMDELADWLGGHLR